LNVGWIQHEDIYLWVQMVLIVNIKWFTVYLGVRFEEVYFLSKEGLYRGSGIGYKLCAEVKSRNWIENSLGGPRLCLGGRSPIRRGFIPLRVCVRSNE
jgi:hypothetical protein